MLTFLTSPKPFIGRDADNQIRAVRSWRDAVPDAQIMLFGFCRDPGDSLSHLDCEWANHSSKNSKNPPLFNDMVEYARIHARYSLLLYVNCDIIIHSLLQTVRNLPGMPEFLITGRRLDLKEGSAVEPGDSLLEQLSKHAANHRIQLHAESGMDYFLFRRGMFGDLPPVFIGRGAFDNALIAYCLRRRIPVVDATWDILALHQYHDYGHVLDGKHTVFSGPEERQNRALHDILHGAPNLGDAGFFCRSGEWQFKSIGWLRRCEVWLRFVKRRKLLSYGVRVVRTLGESLGLLRGERHKLAQLLQHYTCRDRAQVNLVDHAWRK